jgi:hypothetical protein
LPEIPGMKSLSKPQLAIEIYTFWENISTEDFRKKMRGHPTISVGSNLGHYINERSMRSAEPLKIIFNANF